MKTNVIISARNSATTTESQIPTTCKLSGKRSGRTRTAITWKSRVLKNDISAEIGPLLSAVKKDEPKIAKPANKNENE